MLRCSFDESHRQPIFLLGGIPALAELIQVRMIVVVITMTILMTVMTVVMVMIEMKMRMEVMVVVVVMSMSMMFIGQQDLYRSVVSVIESLHCNFFIYTLTCSIWDDLNY